MWVVIAWFISATLLIIICLVIAWILGAVTAVLVMWSKTTSDGMRGVEPVSYTLKEYLIGFLGSWLTVGVLLDLIKDE